MRFIHVSAATIFTIVMSLMTLTGIQSAAADERRIELGINGTLAFGDLVEPEDDGLKMGMARREGMCDSATRHMHRHEDAGHLFNDFYIEEAADLVSGFLSALR